MKVGDIHFTGNEEGGGCWYCGEDLPKRRRRWCCDDHMDLYWTTYNWTGASHRCLMEAKNTCTNCHRSHRDISIEIKASHSPSPGNYWPKYIDAQIEIHHIIPLGGEDRQWHVLNRQDNLLALCHQCHLAVHLVLNEAKREARPYVEAKAKGQLSMPGVV